MYLFRVGIRRFFLELRGSQFSGWGAEGEKLGWNELGHALRVGAANRKYQTFCT